MRAGESGDGAHHSLGDLAGDFLIEAFQVIHRPVVAVGPQVRVGFGYDMLNRSPDGGVIQKPDRSLHDMSHIEGVGQLRDGEVLAAEDFGRVTAGHLELTDLGQLVDDLLRHGQGEEIVGGVACEILQGNDPDGLDVTPWQCGEPAGLQDRPDRHRSGYCQTQDQERADDSGLPKEGGTFPGRDPGIVGEVLGLLDPLGGNVEGPGQGQEDGKSRQDDESQAPHEAIGDGQGITEIVGTLQTGETNDQVRHCSPGDFSPPELCQKHGETGGHTDKMGSGPFCQQGNGHSLFRSSEPGASPGAFLPS